MMKPADPRAMVKPPPPSLPHDDTVRTVLVTGATGSVGRQVVRALATAKCVSVRASSRDPSASNVPFEGVEVVALDFDEPSTLVTAFSGVDAFFFVSPLVEHQSEQALRVIAAATRSGVRHCVRLSSRATGWDDVSDLRRWHREVEFAIERSAMTFTHLRPCSFMQNLLGAPIEGARGRGVFSLPLGAGRIPFVDAFDLGEVGARCLLDPSACAGHTLVLTGAAAWSGDELADVLGAHFRARVRYTPTSHEDARRAAAERGLPAWLVESGLRIYARAGSGEEAEVDPTLERLLRRAPTPLLDFLTREVSCGPSDPPASGRA